MTRSYTAARRELAALRLAAQGIAAAGPDGVAGTVRRMLALQAQDYAGAKWSIGLRTPGTTDADVESAIAAGEIVRSWPMRGTLHFVPPEDLGWILSLTAVRTIRSSETRRRGLGLGEAELATVRDVAHAELGGGRVLTRDALLAAFDSAGVSTSGQRGYHLLGHLGLTQTLVFGPVDGKQQTFALLDEWVPSPRRLEGDEALGEFALRYFTGHGPATVRDFAWWSSLTLTDARRALAVVRESLEELVVDGDSYFLAPGSEAAPPAVHALPGFDEYLLGYQDRSAPLAGRPLDVVAPGKNGLFLSTIVVDGEVVGTWRRTIGARGVAVEAQPFDRLARPAVRGFDAALAGYAGFLGRPLLPRA